MRILISTRCKCEGLWIDRRYPKTNHILIGGLNEADCIFEPARCPALVKIVLALDFQLVFFLFILCTAQ